MVAELTLFWLLLPVAAASGWLLAKRSDAGRSTALRAHLTQNYFQGLQLLANNEPEMALDTLARAFEGKDGTVETQFAIANIFRRRGEVDRAIRIHEHLMHREGLSQEHRELAAYELGNDYLRSGLLDRAENLFLDLAKEERNTQRALSRLLEIYEQEQDWERAIQCAEALQKRCGKDSSQIMAQLLCERADQLLQEQNHEVARSLLLRAVAVDPNCVRVSFMLAQMALKSGDYDTALSHYLRIEMQDPEFISVVLPMMRECYEALGRMEEFKHYLMTLSRRQIGNAPALLLTDLLAADESVANAVQYLSGKLRTQPSISGLDRLIHYLQLQSVADGHEHLHLLRSVTGSLLHGRSAYKCRSCGIETQALYWQCPGCKHWSCIKPHS